MSRRPTTSNHPPNNNNNELLDWGWNAALLVACLVIAQAAYDIRLGAIREYGPVIHEFDPYFNYRATEYLYWNGAKKFFTWFDHMSWYPLGRPVGTTIYPGLQFTAVFIQKFVKRQTMSLNDVCCYIPAWFGVLTSFVTGGIAYETTHQTTTAWSILHAWAGGSNHKQQQQQLTNNNNTTTTNDLPRLECFMFAFLFMAIVPAHLMRSVGGGFDNESIAVFAMVTTFYGWVRSLNSKQPLLWGVITGICYFYMVATWGGYVFVLNMIGIHAAVLVALGRFRKGVYLAYTAFFIVGTSLAIQVPVVSWAPLKSLEQLGPAAVFGAYQILYVVQFHVDKHNLNFWQATKLRIKCLSLVGLVVLLLAVYAAPSGYFGPISSRVRGLFVKHTKTGNPLVDSVAEHQPASSRAYFQYLHHVCSLAPFGYVLVMFFGISDASSFLLVWGSAAYFFSHKMVRLILLTAPIGSILGGIAAGRIVSWCIAQWSGVDVPDEPEPAAPEPARNGSSHKRRGGKVAKKPARSQPKASSGSALAGLETVQSHIDSYFNSREGVATRRGLSIFLVAFGFVVGGQFLRYCWRLSHDLSNPTIIMKARLRDGTIIKLDDYREAYWWLRDNTPEDARVMAWWDYGYQISAIANRTTIADGNTWNHEHIALLGKALTTDLDEGWEIARHLADYLLLWGGGGGDDLAKSPHLARIANSVYRDHCPDDPICRNFGFIDRQGTPSAMMRRSLLYQLHGHGIKPDVNVSKDRFVEVFRSKYGKVRIYKISGVSEESKKWISENYECDAEGSWFCPGKYPPGLQKILDKKKDFAQLEDFNRGDKGDDDYQKKYFEHLNDKEGRRKILEKEAREHVKEKQQKTKNSDELYSRWEDSEAATRMWQLINDNNVEGLKAWLEVEPDIAFVRSKDGRGPMWWAHEKKSEEITKILMKAGVPVTDKDRAGLTPLDLLEGAN